jgi:hypothetical protein
MTTDNEVLVADYVAGDSIPVIAERYEVSRSRVRKAALQAGVLRTRAEGVRKAASEGRLGSGLRGKNRVFTESHKRSISESASRRGEANAKGWSLKSNGYISITRGKDKGRSQHQVVAEMILGRPLRPDEVVHHIDHNRANNDPANLEVMTRSEHTRLHAKERINGK